MNVDKAEDVTFCQVERHWANRTEPSTPWPLYHTVLYRTEIGNAKNLVKKLRSSFVFQSPSPCWAVHF